MKRILISLVLAGVSSVALAQSPAPPPAHGWRGGAVGLRMQRLEQWRLHELTVLLDLSTAQQQQVKSILNQQHAAMRASLQQVMRAVREARQAHLAARREMMSRMAKVLTAAQMVKFKVLMPSHPRFWRHHMGPHGMGPHGMGTGMGPPGPPKR